MQRHLLAQAGLFVHALEVHVQHLGLVGVVLHIAQQHFLHLATEFHVENGGVERFLLQGMPQGVVIEFDRGGGCFTAKNDTGRATGVAQTAARTRTLLGALKSDKLHNVLQWRGSATRTPLFQKSHPHHGGRPLFVAFSAS